MITGATSSPPSNNETGGDKVTVLWNRKDCENWDKVLVSGQHLAMAMTGFNPSGFMSISRKNHRAMAKHIHTRMPFERNGKTLSLAWHIDLCRNAIGFKREYHG